MDKLWQKFKNLAIHLANKRYFRLVIHLEQQL